MWPFPCHQGDRTLSFTTVFMEEIMQHAFHRYLNIIQRQTGKVFLLLFLCLFFWTVESEAQVKQWLKPDSIPAIEPIYNIGQQEFPVGIMVQTPLGDKGDSVGIHWSFARWLNAADWIVPATYWRGGSIAARHLQFDTLAMRAGTNERMILWVDPIDHIGGRRSPAYGQMIEVFPFDTVQSPYAIIGGVNEEWRFLGIDEAKGIVDTNKYYDNTTREKTDWPWSNPTPRERVYSATTDTGLVAEHVAVYHKRGSNDTWDDYVNSNEHADLFFADMLEKIDNGQPHTLFVALKGHLFDEGTASPTDTIFLIELYHIVTPGDKLRDDNLNTVIDTQNAIELVLDTFAVTKAMLTEDAPLTPFDKYRDVSFSIDTRYRLGNTNLVGPLHPNQYTRADAGSPIIDARVFWTGKEKAAFRSLMFRNQQAENIYGSSQASQDFRKAVIDSARRVLHGYDQNGEINLSAPHRPSVLRLESGHESPAVGYGSFRAINRMLQDSLVYNNDLDSIPAGHVDHARRDGDHVMHFGDIDATHLEYSYMNWYEMQNIQKTNPPFRELPSIAEHNGGRDDELKGPARTEAHARQH